jgi:hypothetical protein
MPEYGKSGAIKLKIITISKALLSLQERLGEVIYD